MSTRRRRRHRSGKMLRLCLAAGAVALVLVIGTYGAHLLESRMTVDVENAGKQMTAYTSGETTAQVFMNGQWYQKKEMETVLLIGVDETGALSGSDSYNNTKQADFLVLIARDEESGESAAIHLNRDTMTEITMLGVTGEAAGVQHAQLALAYNYGQGQSDSSRNTADAVSRLLYGVEVDHYITLTMDAVPVLNDWAGGVELKVLDDLSSADRALEKGKEIKLTGEQALTYVRTRRGLDDSTNIKRMERQRQYASAWLETAQARMQDPQAVSELLLSMSDYHYSDCTAQELADLMQRLSAAPGTTIHELPGEAVLGEQYMEYHADDDGIRQLVLELFYAPVT